MSFIKHKLTFEGLEYNSILRIFPSNRLSLTMYRYNNDHHLFFTYVRRKHNYNVMYHGANHMHFYLFILWESKLVL